MDLLGVFNALKEGAKVSDYFDLTTVTEDAAGAAVNAALNKPAATPTPAATQQRTTRRRPGRAGAVDRLSAMALPHPWQGQPRRTRAARLQEH